MRISDWSSDVCSSDLAPGIWHVQADMGIDQEAAERIVIAGAEDFLAGAVHGPIDTPFAVQLIVDAALNRRSLRIDLVPVKERAETVIADLEQIDALMRSEEHTSELQSLMRISYAVLCLTK